MPKPSTEDNYKLVSPKPSNGAGRTSPHSNFTRDGANLSTSNCYGRPSEKTSIDQLDSVAHVVSVLYLAASILIISPSPPFAAELGYTEQIISVGLLLGTVNQCLQRIMPYCLALIERSLWMFHNTELRRSPEMVSVRKPTQFWLETIPHTTYLATTSLKQPLGLSVIVASAGSDLESIFDTIKYRIGDSGTHESIKRQREHG